MLKYQCIVCKKTYDIRSSHVCHPATLAKYDEREERRYRIRCGYVREERTFSARLEEYFEMTSEDDE